jgi:hypothetical protein
LLSLLFGLSTGNGLGANDWAPRRELQNMAERLISERGRGLILAAAILDDPLIRDDDLVVLARQLTQAQEEIDTLTRQIQHLEHPVAGWSGLGLTKVRFLKCEQDAKKLGVADAVPDKSA